MTATLKGECAVLDYLQQFGYGDKDDILSYIDFQCQKHNIAVMSKDTIEASLIALSIRGYVCKRGEMYMSHHRLTG